MTILRTIASIALFLPLSGVAYGQEQPKIEINRNAEMLAETELQINAAPQLSGRCSPM